MVSMEYFMHVFSDLIVVIIFILEKIGLSLRPHPNPSIYWYFAFQLFYFNFSYYFINFSFNFKVFCPQFIREDHLHLLKNQQSRLFLKT